MMLGIDVSHYDEQVDWPVLARGGVAFTIAKLSQGDYYRDPDCRQHLEQAGQAGLRTALYHWVDPQVSPQRQAGFIHECADGLQTGFLCLDVEQHAPWLAAYPANPPKYGRGKPGSKAARVRKQQAVSVNFSPRQISDCARRLAELAREATGLPVVIYTRVSFIIEYARPMLEWIADYPLWLAQYPLLAAPEGHLTWETLPRIYPRASAPLLPAGCSTWDFWQWSGDRLRLPGMRSCADLNFYNGGVAELDALCGVTRLEPSGAAGRLEPLRRPA